MLELYIASHSCYGGRKIFSHCMLLPLEFALENMLNCTGLRPMPKEIVMQYKSFVG